MADWRTLAHANYDPEQAGLRLLLDHTAQAIDPATKQVTVTDRADGRERTLAYDRLVVATGAGAKLASSQPSRWASAMVISLVR